MIACICMNISKDEIIKEVKSGLGCADEIMKKTGACSCCGKCEEYIYSLVSEELSSK